jgi:transmembrane E3 ubiquitin-protein ligase
MPSPNPRASILTVIILLLLLFPDAPQPTGGSTHELDDVVNEETAALAVLNGTRYGDFDPSNDHWLNLTGFHNTSAFAWEPFNAVKGKAKEQADRILGSQDASAALEGKLGKPLPLYHNVSGYVIGEWVRSNIEDSFQAPNLNLSTLFPDRDYVNSFFNRNITGEHGKLHVRLDERAGGHTVDGHVQGVKADVTIADLNSAGDGWEMVLYGEHFVDSGSVLLTTSSEKFCGMFGLPHLALSEHHFHLAQSRLNRTISDMIKKQKSHKLLTLSPWVSTPEGTDTLFATPNCDLVIWLQQHPLLTTHGTLPSVVDPSQIDSVEKELRFPEGDSRIPPPKLTMSAVVFSPDCGFVLESKGPPDYSPKEANHLTGIKEELYMANGRRHSLLFGGVLIAQVLFMKNQIKDASTPSTRSRISFYTVSLLALGDGFVCMAFLPLGMLSTSAFPTFLATAFMAFLAVTFYDLRFMMDVWSVQSQERERQERQAAAENRSPANASNPGTPPVQPPGNTPGTLPPPVTARQAINSGATPIILPPDQDEAAQATPAQPATGTAQVRREVSSLYAKFYLVLLGTIFLSLNASSWYPILRSIYTNTITFIYLSFWVPQIHRNVMRNCRKALLWKFVVCQSLLRLVPVAYFYVYSGNLFFVRTDRRAFLVLVGWIWIQVWILVIQDIFGPRLFVPDGWAPPAYDYHPVLREDEEDVAMPIGFSQAVSSEEPNPPTTLRRPSESKDKGKRIFDCAICMQDIEVPVIPSGGAVESSASATLTGSFLARRSYMVTPCRHIFHTPCLEAAMRYRLQCPICRETLPPL